MTNELTDEERQLMETCGLTFEMFVRGYRRALEDLDNDEWPTEQPDGFLASRFKEELP